MMERIRRFFLRVGAMALKEALHVRRDRYTLYMAFGFPVVLLILFGYGVSFDLDHIPIAVVDQDHTPASRELARSVVASRELRGVATLADPAQVEPYFHRGDAVAAIVIPRGFARDLRRGADVNVQVLVDGSDGNTANQALAKTDAVIRIEGLRVAAGGSTGALAAPITARIWTRFNPQGLSAVFLVPGLIAYVLAMVAVLLTALAIAREWERGSMEQLFATPVGRLDLIVGKLLPYMVIGTVDTMLVLAVGAWLFDMPLRGSIPLLALTSLLFLAGMLGQGLFISINARNQMVATQAGAMSSMLPSVLLSGFIFPVENMPWPLKLLTNLIPARYFVAALRGILLRGNGFADLWRETLALGVFAVFMVGLSTFRFKRRLA